MLSWRQTTRGVRENQTKGEKSLYIIRFHAKQELGDTLWKRRRRKIDTDTYTDSDTDTVAHTYTDLNTVV